MKRIIGVAVGCLLGGCAGSDNRHKSTLMIQNPMLQQRNVRQDTAPLPWVHVLPSERAANFLDADFDYLARRIRHAMTINLERFKGVCLVLVDYAILDAKPTKKKPMSKKYKGQTYCKEYITKPERYFMRISFYGNNQAPPAPPLFVGAAVLSVRHAAPFEAMHFLLDDIIDERLKLPLTQVEVNLDAAEDIEKNLEVPATTATTTETALTHKISSHHETSSSPKKPPTPTPSSETSSGASASPQVPAPTAPSSSETSSGTSASPQVPAPTASSSETSSGTAASPQVPAPTASSSETSSGTAASPQVPAPTAPSSSETSSGTSASPQVPAPTAPSPGTPSGTAASPQVPAPATTPSS